MFSNLRVLVAIRVKYFDAEDYESPIKSILDDRFSYSLNPRIKKISTFYLRKSSISLIDSFFQYGQSQNQDFYSIGQFRDEFQVYDSNSDYLQINILQDSTSDFYERRVYAFMDIIGQLGGFFEVLGIIGGFLVSRFSTRIFYYSLFNKLYHITIKDNSKEDEPISKNSKISPKVSNKFKRKNKKEANSIDKIFKVNQVSNDLKHELENSHTKLCLEKEKEYLNNIEESLSSQRRYSHSWKDYFKTSIPFIKNNSK